MPKRLERIDFILVKRGKANTIEEAKRLVLSGRVKVNSQIVDKPGKRVPHDCEIVVDAINPLPYVSRGGIKLEKALREFNINVKDKIAIDVGASTGGFTDCLLQMGARIVYAVDVGYGLLDIKLRNNSRVRVMERTNIRCVKPEDFEHRFGIATIDVSFISLRKVIPTVYELLDDSADMITLVKPQFEAERRHVLKGGVVKDPKVHSDVLKALCKFAKNMGLSVRGITYPPIRGPAGNIEYLLWLQKVKSNIDQLTDNAIDDTVMKAILELSPENVLQTRLPQKMQSS